MPESTTTSRATARWLGLGCGVEAAWAGCDGRAGCCASAGPPASVRASEAAKQDRIRFIRSKLQKRWMSLDVADFDDSGVRRKDGARGETEKKPVLDDAGDRRERGGERLRRVDPAEMRVENEMAPVGREWPAVCGASEAEFALDSGAFKGRGDRAPGRPEPEGNHLDRQREAAEPLDALRPVGDHHHATARGGDDLFAQKGPAAALDKAQAAVQLVRAVDGEVEFGRVVERGERDALPLRLGARRLGGRHADDRQPAPHALGQGRDEQRGRRASAEAEPHPVRNERRRALGGALQIVRAHRSRPASSMYLRAVNSSMPCREPSRPMPDSLTPPNGATSVEMISVLTPTIPYSSASATRNTRPRSRA